MVTNTMGIIDAALERSKKIKKCLANCIEYSIIILVVITAMIIIMVDMIISIQK
jgi:hypothetical protein